MNKLVKLILLCFILIATSCASQRKVNTVAEADRDGSSFAKAIVVEGVPEEYVWLRQHYPASKMQQQSLVFSKKVPFDILSIVLPDGTKKDVYFDIRKFYGKF